jgi:hypothetical protein
MKLFLTLAGGLSIATAAMMLSQSSQAQTFPAAPQGCVYLKEVTTSKVAIRKVIETNNSNANIDFVVPTGRSFNSYIGKLIPENNARYGIELNLKYNDNTTSRALDRTIQARRFYLYQQPFRTPTNKQPFQINSRITGDRNTAYRVSILACQ